MLHHSMAFANRMAAAARKNGKAAEPGLKLPTGGGKVEGEDSALLGLRTIANSRPFALKKINRI